MQTPNLIITINILERILSRIYDNQKYILLCGPIDIEYSNVNLIRIPNFKKSTIKKALLNVYKDSESYFYLIDKKKKIIGKYNANTMNTILDEEEE